MNPIGGGGGGTLLTAKKGTLHGNVYCEEYARRLEQAISFNLGLAKQLENAELSTPYEISGYKPLRRGCMRVLIKQQRAFCCCAFTCAL